jgi:hypothetical protein
MKHAGEPADDHEIDASVAETLNQAI